MPVSTLHRILLAFDKADALSPTQTMTQILGSIAEVGGQKLRSKSTATDEFLRTGKLPFDATIRMGNDYLDSLSPEAASWIWFRFVSNEKLRTKFVSVSVVLLHSAENFQIQWQISRQIVHATCTHLPVRYALANAKDVDDEHFAALPDVSVLDRHAQLRYIAPLTFISQPWISPYLATSLEQCFTDDQKFELSRGTVIDCCSVNTHDDFALIASCVEKHSDDEITFLRPQVLVTKG